jgi:hypothetical protein
VKLDELAQSAAKDLLDASAMQAVGGLADLRRRRRRRALARGAGVVSVLVLIAGGLAVAGANRVRQAEPAERELGVTNGALLGLPAATGATLDLLSGSLDTDIPLERLLPPSDADQFTSLLGFSPDGTGLRYYQGEGGLLREVDLDSGRRRTVWTCPDEPILCNGWAVPSPDGHHVAHVTGFGNPRLEVTDLRTGDRLVLRGGYSGPPVWSPDSSRLVMATPEGLTVIEVGRGLSSRLLAPFGYRVPVSPSWSPDGTHLAYAEPRAAEGRPRMTSFQLVVMDVATGDRRAIRDLGSCVCLSLWPPQVSWSPDGQLIATSTITSRSLTVSGDVLVMHPDGSGVQKVGVNRNLATLVWQPVPISQRRSH